MVEREKINTRKIIYRLGLSPFPKDQVLYRLALRHGCWVTQTDLLKETRLKADIMKRALHELTQQKIIQRDRGFPNGDLRGRHPNIFRMVEWPAPAQLPKLPPNLR